MPLKLLQQKPATPAQRKRVYEPLMDTEMAPAHREPIKDFDDKSLSGATLESTRRTVDLDILDATMKAPVETGTPVFADQAEADQMLADVPQPLSFNQEFRDARRLGKAEFKHKDSIFNTRQRDESDSDWETVLKDNKGPLLTDFVAGFERERAIEEIPPALEAGNKISPWGHPPTEDNENVRLMSVGGPHPTDPSLDTPVSIVPTMKDGRQMTGDEALAAAQEAGMHLFPQKRTVEQAEEAIQAIHGNVSEQGILTSKPTQRLLPVKNTRTAPTFKMLEVMEAPVETKATAPASPAIVTDELNAKREAEGLTALRMTSGYRDAQQNATAMMNNVEAAGSIAQARANGYTGKHYQPALKAYYADPTRANLEAIGYIRLEREKVISGGHAGGDSADYSVNDLTNKADALKRVAWLKKQGYRARLENWGGVKKGKNAHIHIDGIKH